MQQVVLHVFLITVIILLAYITTRMFAEVDRISTRAEKGFTIAGLGLPSLARMHWSFRACRTLELGAFPRTVNRQGWLAVPRMFAQAIWFTLKHLFLPGD